LRITRRLGVLVAVPLAAVSGFGAVALTASAGEAWRSEHLWSLMHTSDAAGKLLCRLQDERTAMAQLLTSRPDQVSPDLESRIARTDAALAVYRQQIKALPRIPPGTRDLVTRIDQDLNQLATLRTQIRAQSAPALSTVVFQYRIAIADLAQLRESVIGAGSATQPIAARIQSAGLLYQASEATGQEEADVLRSSIGLPLTPAAVAEIAHDRQGYRDAMEAFDTEAPAGWNEQPDEAMSGSDFLTAQQYEDQISRLQAGDVLALNKDAWVQTMSARRTALDTVREEMDLATMSAVARLRDRAEHIAETEAAAVAGTALLVVMISLRLGRPMIRGLRQLRDAAHAVASERLPAAVEELRATDSLTGRTPEEFADHAGDALTLGTGRGHLLRADDPKDELAAVARAFNSVHREALRTAAEQVLLRAGVGATFVALARRGERLTGALTNELDRAERSEQDPDRLARLFVLDHLAARMARNNESLLVLGGEGTARVRDRGVPLLDVVRAALGRIERYTRVDLESVDDGVVVAPQAVDHLVHLCAELLDNATAFSAPDSRVTVEGHRMTDRVIVQIADRGIGMTPARRAELNAQLAAPRQVDSETVRAMGLTVVAHLAAWYGIEVELRGRPGGGTVAEVGLPLSVIAAQDADSVSGAGFGPVAKVNGVNGIDGVNGINGVNGVNGVDGAHGLNGSSLHGVDAEEADWPELPFPDTDDPVTSFSGPAEATATVTAAIAIAANGSVALNGRAPVNGTAATPTTVNGLPVRRPQAQLPPKARRGTSASPAQPQPQPQSPPRPQPRPASDPCGEPASHTEHVKARIDRDPEHMAASMAAYARGLSGRSRPKSQ
jgi:signal transduction histidine kinase